MAVLVQSVNMSGFINNKLQNQLTKSLEKILEDAFLSGELKLSGRKLKEFPKYNNYDLSDTVIADLSKNRFDDLPDELTAYVFMEKLHLSQNVIRNVPETISSLQSLTFLDLSFNQLSELPREICTLSLEILLISNNNLVGLPKEIGRMTALAELDVSNNRLVQVPMTIGDLNTLRILNMSNNQLSLLPLQITYLQLECLDVSCNCISSLPTELRNMSSLVDLNVNHNPLVSPPTTVCMKGRVHIFSYLEKTANKDLYRRDESRSKSSKHTSFMVGTPPVCVHIPSGSNTIDCLRSRTRHNVDSGYSTSDGFDKRWSNEAMAMDESGSTIKSGRSTPSTPSTLSPGTMHSRNTSALNESSQLISESPPENSTGDKNKPFLQQTYRQYKEALKQQRQQDPYRQRNDQGSPSSVDSNSPPYHNQSPSHTPNTPSPLTNGHSCVNNKTLPSNGVFNNSTQAQSSPLIHSTPRRYQSSIPQSLSQNGSLNESANGSNGKSDEVPNKKPVQKVVPSRNINNKSFNYGVNGNCNIDYQNGRNISPKVNMESPYIKPVSPTKSPMTLQNMRSGIPARKDVNCSAENGTSPKILTTTVAYLKGSSIKPVNNSSRISWNKEVPPDKLSFTMKREFDKQKEETDLLEYLRVTLESRLKMTLPTDLAPVLSDGVVLCHLANNLRPRSVASVHVPSPAQPKLTMARCRRNVENFLEACRKMGVEEEYICLPEDILSWRSDHDGPKDPIPVLITLQALLTHANQTTHLINTQDERIISNFNVHSHYTIEETDKFTYNSTETTEAYEYESDVRKLRQFYEEKNVNYVKPTRYKGSHYEIVDTDEYNYLQRTIDYYDKGTMSLNFERNLNKEQDCMRIPEMTKENGALITFMSLGMLIATVLILYIYPMQ